MSLTLKLSSLVIRTLSKPIANQIKNQAREHERFRHVCVSMAQTLHRIDMRLRLGLIRDTSAIEQHAAKEAADAEARKFKPKVPTAKTEAEVKAEGEAIQQAKKKAIEHAKSRPPPKIRPLSESKAIDSGANFISETFLFLVAGGLIVFESWRSRRKETTRREDVQDRLNELEQSEKAARRALVVLEKEILELKAHQGKKSVKDMKRVLPSDVWEVEETEEEPKNENTGWTSRIVAWFSSPEQTIQSSQVTKTSEVPSPREGAGDSSFPSVNSSPSATTIVLNSHKAEPSSKES
ncbi:OPA3 domain protein [Talaromyces proteolyticus]|uniref:OPA3 domain protein n=1 Tax=Talaromyces proteolyticus TaxID=1131652 RepID=A0AAD4PSV4_9EURO|nr:OPA3 domain protein [Talaromyces proteolyticus]KAH8692111.1 OPA3 domain protein [Talaromyces proteolyticus]